MMNAAIHEEVSKQVGSFMNIMASQPLSLALVIMNFALVVFLFYSNNQVLSQRQSALTQIVEWQQRTDNLMASCVSIDVMKLVVDALERDRSLYRQMLPQQYQQPTPEQPKPEPQKDSPLKHLLPPGERRSELEGDAVPYVVFQPPLPTPRPSDAPHESVPADHEK